MLVRSRIQRLIVGLPLVLALSVGSSSFVFGQEQQEITRKVKNRVAPIYPELARRMSITGVVKVQITVDKNGVVKNTKLVGGHPILANSALEAVRKWRFESAAEETTGVVEFHFDPTQ